MYKPAFPYFGAKGKVASLIWERFGSVNTYVEPFFGSGAVLLSRPSPFSGMEVVNDINADLVNFWRAVKADPDGVAEYADWPASELDLHARGDHLFYRSDVEEFIERMRGDPSYYDVKRAGWWVWGMCTSVGISVTWRRDPSKSQVDRCRPNLCSMRGVHREVDVHKFFRDLALRLRRVVICCGDWTRVCGPGTTVAMGTTAVFLDPPYGDRNRDIRCYGEHDSYDLSSDVRQWCLQWQDDPRMRIALCGYEGEHNLPGWECVEWGAHGGLGVQAAQDSQKSQAYSNRSRERIWFSPHCLKPPKRPPLLLEEALS